MQLKADFHFLKSERAGGKSNDNDSGACALMQEDCKVIGQKRIKKRSCKFKNFKLARSAQIKQPIRSQLATCKICRIFKPTPPKMMKAFQHCKDSLWKRWKSEYLLTLCEKHHCLNTLETSLKIDIVQVKDDHKNRREWHVGVVTKPIYVKNVLVGAKMKMGNNKLLE